MNPLRPLAAALALSLAPVASATWSIVLADTATREVAVGTVTCLTGYDLLAIVPVVVVGEGAGACQAAGDFNGIRRPVIFAGFQAHTPVEGILAQLAQISGHQQRQYGLADVRGGALTFTGTQTLAWAGGVTGSYGTMVYAIQGNILVGDCVVAAIEQAILGTDGDMAERLMAGMEAARAMGGDGRCSCSQSNPTGCGCPPDLFTKSGHIGGMIVARVGDVDDVACNSAGCADGSYFMRLNVPFQSSQAVDPVIQLRNKFDAWRDDLVGRIDALRTEVLGPDALPANGLSTAHLRIVPLDWSGAPVAVPPLAVEVMHADGSDQRSTILPAEAQPDGSWIVPIVAGVAPGVDRLEIVLDDGEDRFVLAPDARLELRTPGDVDGDGAIGFADLLAMLSWWGPCPAPEIGCLPDADGDGAIGPGDLGIVLAGWN